MTTLDIDADQIAKADRIRDLVCIHFGVSLEKMKSSRRPDHIAWPRQVAMALEYKITKMASEDIAVRYNKKCHATVLNAVRVVKERSEAYPSIRAAIEKLEQMAKEPQDASPATVDQKP